MTPNPCSIAAQLTAASGAICRQARGARRRHPLSGVLMEAGASMAVLTYLRGEGGGYRTAADILQGTGRSHSAVSWALLFLRRIGLVESVPDSRRNARYLRYRAKLSENRSR